MAKLTYVTGPDEPCDVGGEVRPPKAVDDVCSCHKVSMMSSGVVSSGENRWPFFAVNDYFMTALRIPLPKTAIYLEEVFGILQESSVCSIGEPRRMFGGLEPFANASQMVIGSVGSIGSGETVVGERWFVGDVCRGQSQT